MIAKCISIGGEHPSSLAIICELANLHCAAAVKLALPACTLQSLPLCAPPQQKANNNTYTLADITMGANGFASTTHNGERNHIKSEQIGEGNLVGCKPEIMRRSADGCVRGVCMCAAAIAHIGISFILSLPLRCCCAWNREIIKNALALRLMLYTWI
jgi:hypothetical protein